MLKQNQVLQNVKVSSCENPTLEQRVNKTYHNKIPVRWESLTLLFIATSKTITYTRLCVVYNLHVPFVSQNVSNRDRKKMFEKIPAALLVDDSEQLEQQQNAEQNNLESSFDLS